MVGGAGVKVRLFDLENKFSRHPSPGNMPEDEIHAVARNPHLLEVASVKKSGEPKLASTRWAPIDALRMKSLASDQCVQCGSGGHMQCMRSANGADRSAPDTSPCR